MKLGYSPCPNDTFIFYALMNGKIDSEIGFDQIFADVETLNRMAMETVLDVTKVSFSAMGYVQDDYCLLNSGGALGKGCGPLVVARESMKTEELAGRKIAAPGRYTTAFLLLQLLNPVLGNNVIFMPFDRIMESVKRGDADAGLIIHESRFTYPLYGLKEIIDLGRWWEEETSLPIPLGGIAVKRELGSETAGKLETLIRSSIEYAFANRAETLPYLRAHAREMSDDVIGRHVDLYVNAYSLEFGSTGKAAIAALFRRAEEAGLFPKKDLSLFIE